MIGHLQRNLAGDGRAPDLAWQIETRASPGWLERRADRVALSLAPASHAFTQGEPCSVRLEGGRPGIGHPTAPWKRCGLLEVRTNATGRLLYRYWRCRAEERVPMLEAARHRAECIVAPADLPSLTPALEQPQAVEVDWRVWDCSVTGSCGLVELGQAHLGASFGGEFGREEFVERVARGQRQEKIG